MLKNGEINMLIKNKTPTTIAENPVLPPTEIPVPLSIKVVTDDVPQRAPISFIIIIIIIIIIYKIIN
jgi:hypothetical protein